MQYRMNVKKNVQPFCRSFIRSIIANKIIFKRSGSHKTVGFSTYAGFEHDKSNYQDSRPYPFQKKYSFLLKFFHPWQHNRITPELSIRVWLR